MWALSLLLVTYVVVCFWIVRSTRLAREKTKALNAVIISEGERAERELYALTYIAAHVGEDVLGEQLSSRTERLHASKQSKDRVQKVKR